ncbi:uncharacterized protein LOC115079450 isoform X2 [Rhinatrema bivittatum]|uniref:uncharacterized protein LOC115079450 isoform X2 n=1 Tax=Rhinatrema bivittatum TaxID=194408 RepID=UPI00112944D3|nr:uncharacterized protein LOC115079450 isoform X2 [Rhinatrema bivittatum]XP_029438921.1 uncharacterized protein LOC115079450 isoform X2 [Rhinatrema bivittatum]XP_029438922.1 uncharacterized protein LOC115079450 isoform X2 [Rhinatrema bivittatum]XP_029438923.1 uncharacterized protein LOC115079450 isoform X2 [Rhinatrema bivittatum]
MVSKNPRKKKKFKCCPGHSTAFPEAGSTEPITHEELEEKALKVLCHCGKYLACMEGSKKRRKKKKEIQAERGKSRKHKIKWKTLEVEMMNLSELCAGKENLAPYQEKSVLSGNVLETDTKKVKKSKLQVYNEENCLHKKKSKKNNSCKSPSVASLPSPSADKKAKGVKQMKHKKHGSSSVLMSRSQMRQQRLYKYLSCYPSQNSSFIEETEQTIDVRSEDVSRFKAVCQSEVLGSVFQSSGAGNLRAINKLKRRAPVCESLKASCHELKACPRDTESSPSAHPAAPEKILDDLEDELYAEDVKCEEPSPLANSRTQEACSSVDLSQDLFITQKSFEPILVSSSDDDDDSCSSFQKNTKEIRAEDDYNHPRPINGLQWFSQAPSKRLKAVEQFHTAGTKLASSARKKRILTKEKATQTDGCLSCPVSASSISHAKRFVNCSVQPLDLSLPSRVRSSSASTKGASCPLSGESDGIYLSPKFMQNPMLRTEEEQLPTPNILSMIRERDREKCPFSQLRKYEEGKYVQMLLNSSYFFKGKGEIDISTPIAPLLKQRAENEKRLSAEDRRERTRSGSTLRQ